MKPESQWQERLHFHFLATHLVTTHNRHEKQAIHSSFLAGGTRLTLFEDVTSHQVKSGINTSGLGCWSWSLVRGQAAYTIRFISAYQPVCNMVNHGSPWQQHKQFLLFKNIS
jgi:hypothetical protein